jgi:hypothetical protein
VVAARTGDPYDARDGGCPAHDGALELGRADTLSSPQLPGFALQLAALVAG